MKKLLKIIISASLVSVLLGSTLFLCSFIAAGGDFKDMTASTVNYQTHTGGNDVTSIEINFERASIDIDLIFDEDATGVTVSYPATETTKNGTLLQTVTLTENAGKITLSAKRTMADFFLFLVFSYDLKVTLTLPASSDISLDFTASTGDIAVNGEGRVKNLAFETDTGDIKVNDKITAKTANFEADTGDISLNAIVAETLGIEVDTGDVRLGSANVSGMADISVDTGSIYLSGRLTAERLEVESDTGDIKMKDGIVDASKINIETDTGEVFITLAGALSDYAVIVYTDTGDSNVKGNAGGPREILVNTDTGDVRIYFEINP